MTLVQDVLSVARETYLKTHILLQVRKYVYHDADNLDTAFDAGGKVSIGLTATTIVSQWTWSATLLQSSTVASKVSTNTAVHRAQLQETSLVNMQSQEARRRAFQIIDC